MMPPTTTLFASKPDKAIFSKQKKNKKTGGGDGHLRLSPAFLLPMTAVSQLKATAPPAYQQTQKVKRVSKKTVAPLISLAIRGVAGVVRSTLCSTTDPNVVTEIRAYLGTELSSALIGEVCFRFFYSEVEFSAKVDISKFIGDLNAIPNASGEHDYATNENTKPNAILGC